MKHDLMRGGAIVAAYVAAALLVSVLQPGRFPLPIFPSSGIALAVVLVLGWRYWPAIWIAAFGFAAYSLYRLGGPLEAQGYSAAAVIATGAVLEAGAGRRLIGRKIGFPTPLDTPRDIGWFLVLGGPVACLIGASVSLSGLLSLDLVAAQEGGLHWVGWWVGDSIGVLVGAPLTLILIAQPRTLWRPRVLSVAPLLTLSTVLIANLMLQVGPLDIRQQRETFRQESQRARGLVHRAVEDACAWLDWARRYAAPPNAEPDHAELTSFAQALRQRSSAVEALVWLSAPSGAAVDPGTQRRPVPQWEIVFAEPRTDIAAVAARHPELLVALEQVGTEMPGGGPTRSHVLPLGPRAGRPGYAVAVLQPIDHRGDPMRGIVPESTGGGRHFLVLFLDLARVPGLSDASERQWRLCLLARHHAAVRAGIPDAAACPADPRAGEFSARHAIHIGGEPWTLVATAPAALFVSGQFGFHSSALLVASVLLTGLFAASLLILSGNSRRIQEIVLDRTRRLDLSARVFESTAEGIVITDAERRIVSVNPSCTAITGYPSDEVLGQDPRMFAACDQDSGCFGLLWEALTEQGRWQGEIWSRRKTGETFPAWMTISTARDGDGRILNYIATFTDISHQKQAAEHIHHLAYFDALTGLANRSLLELRGEQAIAATEPASRMLAVLFLDVDRFKTINDSLGHLAGDQLLKTVAERLRCSVRDEDTVARLGGDEFVVLLAALSCREDAALLARQIIDALARPTQIENHEIAVTVSIGISLYPYDGVEFPALVKNADVALYKAKESGRNRFQFFEPAMSAHSFERLVLENALRGALDRGELMLYFQPQVNIATGLVVGAEALLRWRHPQMGIIGPTRFIRLAEEGGMIAAIGEWVIRSVCQTLARWQAEGVPCTPIAVNISALQFNQDLADLVSEALRQSGIAPQLLELELTESLLMSSADDSVGTLRKLHRLGVCLSIDDFGTGYSSLSYLKRFPIHKLKIDQSFIREIPGDANDEAITRTIIGLANNLHLRVVAEGVETQAQSDFLHSVGCHEIQGSHVAQPMPVDEFAAWISDRGGRRYPIA